MLQTIGFASPEELIRFLLPNVATMWIALAAVLAIYAIMSVVFVYHWRTFGFDKPATDLAAAIYFVVSGSLVAGMVAALVFYSYGAPA